MMADAMITIFPSIIELNVGGTKFTTRYVPNSKYRMYKVMGHFFYFHDCSFVDNCLIIIVADHREIKKKFLHTVQSLRV